MVIATGFEFDYTDPATGFNLPASWIEVGKISFNAEECVCIEADVHQSAAAFEAGNSPLFRLQRMCLNGDANFSSYFALSVLDSAGKNILSASRDYLVLVL